MAELRRDDQLLQAGSVSGRAVPHRLLGGILQPSSGGLLLGQQIPRGRLLRLDNAVVKLPSLANFTFRAFILTI